MFMLTYGGTLSWWGLRFALRGGRGRGERLRADGFGRTELAIKTAAAEESLFRVGGSYECAWG